MPHRLNVLTSHHLQTKISRGELTGELMYSRFVCYFFHSLHELFSHFQNFIFDLNSSNEAGSTYLDGSFAQISGALCFNVFRP